MREWRREESGVVLSVRHPGLEIRVCPVDGKRSIPDRPGVYVLLATSLSIGYAGQSVRLRGRVPASIVENLPSTTHVLTAVPIGADWTVELDPLEMALLSGLPQLRANRRFTPMACKGELADYLDAVVAEIVAWVELLLPTVDGAAMRRSQAQATRDLVLSARDRPMSIAELTDALRRLGHPLDGATPWATLRRDCCAAERGGDGRITFGGPLNDPDTLVLVAGRRYPQWAATPRHSTGSRSTHVA